MSKSNLPFSSYANGGLTGLANVGNTCYLNSCVQVLSHTYELNNFLKSDFKARVNSQLPDATLLLEWNKLREVMWSRNGVVAPMGFVTSVQRIAKIKNRELFTGHAQNDSSEFLLFLIEGFHNALAREVDMEINGHVADETDKLALVSYKMMQNMYQRDYSEMLTLFHGIHVSNISAIDQNQESLSLTAEPFSIMSLPIPANLAEPTLFDCLDLYCAKEILEGSNAWLNPKTQERVPVHRGILFWSLPQLLIIDLKRWNTGSQEKQKPKVQKLVRLGLTNLDFSSYVAGYNPTSYIYDLYGVCNHSGGSLGGHYTANVKNANGKWYNFNDTNVKEIAELNVVTNQAYCLFLRKKNV